VVEHPLGKGEVAGPIPAKGTSFAHRRQNFGGVAIVVVHALLFGV
jgi:hypothetical protein